ncbi:MAG: hypothetical protein KAS04_01665 [Candidatus Aenigmarchaeota archaeon]|nr:hypothetical protein [Candidatus Aenigmarchaeota archaeon]
MEITIPDIDGWKIKDALLEYSGPHCLAAADVVEQIENKLPIEIILNQEEAKHLAFILDGVKTDNWKLTGKLIDKVSAKL